MMLQDFDLPICVDNEQIYNKKIEENIVNDIINNLEN